jgi:FMN phosphatase YigB (HAD superfamily)
MPSNRDIEVVFFDIGGTLGERDRATGTFLPYPSSAGLLQAMRQIVGLRVGIITTLGPDLTNADGLALLQNAGLALFLDPQGFVSDHDAGVAKPHVAIYQLAAQRVNVPIGRCRCVGENLIEVLGASAAGMEAVLKPCPPGRDVAG